MNDTHIHTITSLNLFKTHLYSGYFLQHFYSSFQNDTESRSEKMCRVRLDNHRLGLRHLVTVHHILLVMLCRCVSRDLKAHIPHLIYVGGFKVKEVEHLLGVKKSMIYQTLNYFRDYGVTYNLTAYSHHSRGCHRKLDTVDVRFTKALLDQEPCLYLDELQDWLLTH